MSGRIHLYLPASLEEDAERVIAGGIELSRRLDAAISASIPRVTLSAPAHWLAQEYTLKYAQDLNARSIEEARQLTARVEQAAAAGGAPLKIIASTHALLGFDRQAVMTARTHDLTVIGLRDHDASSRDRAEEFLFDSGRPVFVLPLSRPAAIDLECAVVAWDHTEPAARALLGALPLLKKAERVHVLTMRGAKRLLDAADGADAGAYLASHGLKVSTELIEANDDHPGARLMEAAIARGAGLLVMGGYSTLRAREYVLGGVTRGVLDAPLLPVLMAN